MENNPAPNHRQNTTQNNTLQMQQTSNKKLDSLHTPNVGQLRWKEHIKKHKKFLIFLINKLDFISLRKIRNNDSTVKYIIQAADIHLR